MKKPRITLVDVIEQIHAAFETLFLICCYIVVFLAPFVAVSALVLAISLIIDIIVPKL